MLYMRRKYYGNTLFYAAVFCMVSFFMCKFRQASCIVKFIYNDIKAPENL